MPKLRHGVGANCTVLTKFVHPSEHVRALHTNLDKGHKTSVILVGQEIFKVRRKDQKCYTFRSDDYPNVLLDAALRNVVVVSEGPESTLFNNIRVNVANDASNVESAAPAGPIMPPRTNDHNDDIQALTAMGAIVDDDNLTATENIPTPNEARPVCCVP